MDYDEIHCIHGPLAALLLWGLVQVALKLAGFGEDASWLLVTFPLWFAPALIAGVFLIFGGLMLCAGLLALPGILWSCRCRPRAVWRELRLMVRG